MPKPVTKKPTFGGKLMFPSDYLAAVEFQGRDVTLKIRSVERESLRRTDGENEPAFIVRFEETKKKLVLNKTNAAAIATLTGETEAQNWVGRRVTLYPTTCQAFGAEVECIRVRSTTSGSPDPTSGDTVMSELEASLDKDELPATPEDRMTQLVAMVQDAAGVDEDTADTLAVDWLANTANRQVADLADDGIYRIVRAQAARAQWTQRAEKFATTG